MFNRKKKRLELNQKGKYATVYFIRKYINEEKVDPIEAYEYMLDECMKRLKEAKYFEFIKSTLKQEDFPITDLEVQRIFAVLITVSITIRLLPEEEKQYYLNLITNKERRKKLEKSLNSDMFKF